jgi:hypothetical protein
VVNLPLTLDEGAGFAVDARDVDGDGRAELLAVDRSRNEFVFVDNDRGGFRAVRSPAPTGVEAFALFRGTKGPVAFSFSPTEGLFGVSRIENGRLSFPRPLHTAGPVQGMQLEELPGVEGGWALLWVEKSGAGFVVRMQPAERLAAAVFDGQAGSLELTGTALAFGPGAEQREALTGRPKKLAFADFNRDGRPDVVVFWSYSGKESLFLGQEGWRFQEIIREEGLLDEGERRELLVEDLEGDGQREVLQVKPGFVRVLRVDGKGRLFVERQLNWTSGSLEHLVRLDTAGGRARFVVKSGPALEVLSLDSDGRFAPAGRIDLAGQELQGLLSANLDPDGRPDLVGWNRGSLVLLQTGRRVPILDDQPVFDAPQTLFRYVKLFAADLDRDGRDELLLFDRRKGAMEILRQGKQRWDAVLRVRLYERHLTRPRKEGGEEVEQPRAVRVADLDGNGTPDVAFVLHDRLAIYLQGAKAAPAPGGAP